MNQPIPLTFSILQQALADSSAAIRCCARLKVAGGNGDKVFPPTYQGGIYATEERQVIGDDGMFHTVPTVLLNSVQADANRIEQSLWDAYEEGQIRFPLPIVDFAAAAERFTLPEEKEEMLRIGQISALQAPHRSADAILRDSYYGDDLFRKSEEGKRITRSRVQDATGLFQFCPTSLLFGVWDSTGLDSRGGNGHKFSRAIASEIVGFKVVAGVRPSSRICPVGIEGENIDTYKDGNDSWDFKPASKAGAVKLKSSQLNHGNILPSLYYKDKVTKKEKLNPGGFTITHAVQTVTISLNTLRQLRFPLEKEGVKARVPAADQAAHILLAALGLVGVIWQQMNLGYALRSRCWLDLDGVPTFDLIRHGTETPHTLDVEGALEIFRLAVENVQRQGLPWNPEPMMLRPMDNLCRLILKSRQAAALRSSEADED